MHEVSIVQNIFRIVREKMDQMYGKTLPVKSIRVVIGQMSTVVPRALEFAFEMLQVNTPFEGVKIDVEYVPLKIKCSDCLVEEILDEPFLFCRQCDSFNVEILTGKELYVDSFEVDDSKLETVNIKETVRRKDGDKSSGKDTVKK